MSAEINLQIYKEYEGNISEWRRKAQKLVNFYNGTQYSQGDRKTLKDMGLKPLVINIVRPLILQQLAILTSSKPTWKVLPVQGASKDVADISQRFLVGKWNSDYSDIQLSLALKDMLILGLGWLFVDLANRNIENEAFDIRLRRLNWKYIYPDPQCTEFDFSDAENLVIRKPIGLQKAQVVYGLSRDDVVAAVGTQIPTSSDSAYLNQQVDALDRYSKYPVSRWEWTDAQVDRYTRTDLRSMPPTVFYTSDLEDTINKEYLRYVKDLKSLAVDGKIELKEYKDNGIYRCLSLGRKTIYEGVMNIRDYPLIPFTDEFSDEAKRITGEAEPLMGIQEAHNKYYMLTLHNAMLTGNVRVLAAKDTIKNKTEFQKTWAVPGAVWEWEPDPSLADGGKPQIIMPGQLSSAFYDLSKDLMQKAEYESAMFGPMRGDSQSSPETFSTTATLQNFGAERLKYLARRVDVQMAKAGEVMLQFIQNYAKESELLTYIDDKQFGENGIINPSYGQEVPAGELNTPVYDADTVKELKNDTKIGKFRVKVLTQPNLGTDRAIKAAFMVNMVANKALPPTPAVMKRIFDMMEVPGYLEIISEMSAGQANQQQVQQLVQQLQVLQKQNMFLQGEADKLGKKLEISDFRNTLDRELLKIEKEVHGAKSDLALAVQGMQSQLDAAISSSAPQAAPSANGQGETNAQ